MAYVKTSEQSVTSMRANLSRLIREAHNNGAVTLVTSNGFMVAAICPVEALDGPGEQGYGCPRCDLPFASVKELLSHIRTAHERKE